jgi:hypothetical protein
MFGGFDGEFFNDLHVMDLEHSKRGLSTQIDSSTMIKDFALMVNNPKVSDIKLRVNLQNGHIYCFYLNKSLLLYRALEKEVPIRLN